MIAVIKRLWKHGIGTRPKCEIQRIVGRGKLQFDVAKCSACGECALECPTEALTLCTDKNGLLFSIAYDSCIACRVCTAVCPTGAFSITTEPLPSVRHRNELVAHYTIIEIQTKQGEEQSDRDPREVVREN